MKLLKPMFTSTLARPAHWRLAISRWPSLRQPNTFVLHSKLLGILGLAFALLAVPGFASPPAIIPLPKTMTNYPRIFTVFLDPPLSPAPPPRMKPPPPTVGEVPGRPHARSGRTRPGSAGAGGA